MPTLIDGTEVDSYSEAWRHECEARAVLAMPSLSRRRAYLYGRMNDYGRMVGGVRQIRGEAAVKKLEETMRVIWNMRARNEC